MEANNENTIGELVEDFKEATGREPEKITIDLKGADRKCLQCGNELITKRKDKKFCSNTCRAKHSAGSRNRLGSITPNITSSYGTNSNEMINHYKFLYQQQLDRYKELLSEHNDLKSMYSENLSRISELTNEMSQSKGGLSGLLQSDVGQQLMATFAPALGKMAEKFIDSSQGDPRHKLFVEWLIQQPDSFRETVMFIAEGLSALNDDNRQLALVEITNALNPEMQTKKIKEYDKEQKQQRSSNMLMYNT